MTQTLISDNPSPSLIILELLEKSGIGIPTDISLELKKVLDLQDQVSLQNFAGVEKRIDAFVGALTNEKLITIQTPNPEHVLYSKQQQHAGAGANFENWVLTKLPVFATIATAGLRFLADKRSEISQEKTSQSVRSTNQSVVDTNNLAKANFQLQRDLAEETKKVAKRSLYTSVASVIVSFVLLLITIIKEFANKKSDNDLLRNITIVSKLDTSGRNKVIIIDSVHTK